MVHGDSKVTGARQVYPSDVSGTPLAPRVLGSDVAPAECPTELVERLGADILATVEHSDVLHQQALGVPV
jgi:hypothetical protein